MQDPKFRDPKTLTHEQLTDPDYSLKRLAEQRFAEMDIGERLELLARVNAGQSVLTCTKCHHCR